MIEGGQSRGDRCHVLIVEEDTSIRLGLAEMLRVDGYDVEVAEGPWPALRKSLNFSPDLVLVDLDLPRSSQILGAELVEILHRILPGARIVTISSWGDEEIAQMVQRGEVAALLEKPIEPVSLKHVLHTLVSSEASVGATPPHHL